MKIGVLTWAGMILMTTGLARGQTPDSGGPSQAGPCREYQSQIMVGGKPRQVIGTACRQADGAWKIINQAPKRAEQDRARDAVAAGQALPLPQIMARVRSRYPGRLLDARLNRGRGPGAWTYRIKLLTPQSRVLLLDVDAGSGRILGVTGGNRLGRRR